MVYMRVYGCVAAGLKFCLTYDNLWRSKKTEHFVCTPLFSSRSRARGPWFYNGNSKSIGDAWLSDWSRIFNSFSFSPSPAPAPAPSPSSLLVSSLISNNIDSTLSCPCLLNALHWNILKTVSAGVSLTNKSPFGNSVKRGSSGLIGLNRLDSASTSLFWYQTIWGVGLPAAYTSIAPRRPDVPFSNRSTYRFAPVQRWFSLQLVFLDIRYRTTMRYCLPSISPSHSPWPFLDYY